MSAASLRKTYSFRLSKAALDDGSDSAHTTSINHANVQSEPKLSKHLRQNLVSSLLPDLSLCKSNSNMDNSLFGRLPAEMRNEIYHALHPNGVIRITIYDNRHELHPDDMDTCRSIVALARTCIGISSEILSHFYGTNAFQFTLPDCVANGNEEQVEMMDSCIRSTGEKNLSFIKKMVVNLGKWVAWCSSHRDCGAFQQVQADWTLTSASAWLIMIMALELPVTGHESERVKHVAFETVEETRNAYTASGPTSSKPACLENLDKIEECLEEVFAEWEDGSD
jgi:hypothetical protein